MLPFTFNGERGRCNATQLIPDLQCTASIHSVNTIQYSKYTQRKNERAGTIAVCQMYDKQVEMTLRIDNVCTDSKGRCPRSGRHTHGIKPQNTQQTTRLHGWNTTVTVRQKYKKEATTSVLPKLAFNTLPSCHTQMHALTSTSLDFHTRPYHQHQTH